MNLNHDGLIWNCSTCGAPAIGVSILVRSIECKKKSYTFGPSNMYVDGSSVGKITDVVATYLFLEGNVEFYPYCQEHESSHNYYSLKCRLTEEVKQEIQKKIHIEVDTLENNRAVKAS